MQHNHENLGQHVPGCPACTVRLEGIERRAQHQPECVARNPECDEGDCNLGCLSAATTVSLWNPETHEATPIDVKGKGITGGVVAFSDGRVLTFNLVDGDLYVEVLDGDAGTIVEVVAGMRAPGRRIVGMLSQYEGIEQYQAEGR